MTEREPEMLGVLAMRPHGPAHIPCQVEYTVIYGDPDCRWLLPGESYCSLAFWLGAEALEDRR